MPGINRCRLGRRANLILVASCAAACASPTRNYVSEGDAGTGGHGGAVSSTAGGSIQSSAGSNSQAGAITTGGAGTAGTPLASGGTSSTGDGGSATNGGASGQTAAGSGGDVGAAAGAGGSVLTSGGTVSSSGGPSANGGSFAMGGGSVSVAGSAATVGGSVGVAGSPTTGGSVGVAGSPTTGGTTSAATGGSATGGMATGGASPLGNGQPCSEDGSCQSGNCRLAPNDLRYCVTAGSACATNAGADVAVGSKFCAANSSETCVSKDVLTSASCAIVSDCQVGSCDTNSGNCGVAPGNQGALCPSGATIPTGACDAGACAPLRFVPPAGSTWTNVDSAPVRNVPANCGTPNNLPCAIGDFRFAWPPDSRQTKCYDNSTEIVCPGTAGGANCATTPFCGQDGQYGADLTHPTWATGRFVQSGTAGSDVVTDNITGLVWTVSTQSAMQMPWATGQQFCSDLSSAVYGGRNDWKLPAANQLFALFNFSLTGAGAPTSFPGMDTFYLWSSSPLVSSTTTLYFASMASPYIYVVDQLSAGMTSVIGARCSSSSNLTLIATPRFYSTGAAPMAIIFDTRTGLSWQQTFDGTLRGWSAALAYCENLDYAGRTDWRLPNVLELDSLIDYSRHGPAIDPVVFPGTPGGNFDSYFWTSTTVATKPDSAWVVRFQEGLVTQIASGTAKAGATPSTNPVRCVAGGLS
jgi:hypothetical protein